MKFTSFKLHFQIEGKSNKTTELWASEIHKSSKQLHFQQKNVETMSGFHAFVVFGGSIQILVGKY